MYRAIIIDDEAHCRQALIQTLAEVSPALQVIACCDTADTGKEAIAQGKPDLVFLDVEMPNKDGFAMLSELQSIPFEIIFTTGHEQYAVQAIRSSALDFLLKPFSPDDLKDALNRFELKRTKEDRTRQVETLLQNFVAPKSSFETIVVPTNTGLEFIATREIIRLEANSSYTTFFMADGTRLMVAKTLKEIEQMLPAQQFFRVHHSHVVNIGQVKRFQKGEGGAIIMMDKSNVPVSRQRKEELLEFLKSASFLTR